MDLQYLKKMAFYAVSLVLAVLAVMYVTYHLFNGFQSEVETYTAIKSVERETVLADAYIFRSEKVIYSKDYGGVNYLLSNGEKVGIGYPVANVYAGAQGNALQQKIIEIDNKISVLEASSISSNMVGSDTASLDSQINALYYLIREKLENGDFEYAAHKKDELLTLLNKRQLIVETISGYDERIKELEEEKERLASAFESAYDPVYAPFSGWFYSEVDGYESLFSSDNINGITLNTFDTLEASEPEEGLFEGEEGYAICKLVTEPTWYIACKVEKDELKSFSSGEKYSVIFPYNEDAELDMTLYRIVTQTDSDQAVMIFSASVMPSGFDFLRKQSVQIADNTYSGYKIPTSSVRIVDGVQGVYILDGRVVRFKKIVPLLEKDGYFIVMENELIEEDNSAYLDLYDNVIIYGKGLYDGKIIT